MSKLAKNAMLTKESTISRVVIEYLEMIFYVRRCQDFLTTCSKVIKVDRCPKFLNNLRRHVPIFVDDKNFIVDEAANHKNMQIIACDSSDVRSVILSKILLIMVFAAVASNWMVMSPYFIITGLKISIAEFINILKDVLLPKIYKYCDATNVMLVEDCTSEWSKKISKITWRRILLCLYQKILYSSFPVMNDLNYWLFNIIKRKC